MGGEKYRQARNPANEIGMMLLWLAAIVSLIVWGVLVFAVQIPSGWVHLPLALGCVLAARGIIGRTRRAPR